MGSVSLATPSACARCGGGAGVTPPSPPSSSHGRKPLVASELLLRVRRVPRGFRARPRHRVEREQRHAARGTRRPAAPPLAPRPAAAERRPRPLGSRLVRQAPSEESEAERPRSRSALASLRWRSWPWRRRDRGGGGPREETRAGRGRRRRRQQLPPRLASTRDEELTLDPVAADALGRHARGCGGRGRGAGRGAGTDARVGGQRGR